MPPGSPASPSGDRLGPRSAWARLRLTSEHDNCENCTPKSGPDGCCDSSGSKCSWMIWPAVRVVNAFPLEDRNAPVKAFDMAAALEEMLGTCVSRPSLARPLEISTEVGALAVR